MFASAIMLKERGRWRAELSYKGIQALIISTSIEVESPAKQGNNFLKLGWAKTSVVVRRTTGIHGVTWTKMSKCCGARRPQKRLQSGRKPLSSKHCS
jgi:hypothetical protein